MSPFVSGEGSTADVEWLPFCVTVEALGGARCVVSLSGEIDMDTAPQFEQAVLGAIEQGAEEIAIDLTRVTFVDSSCIPVLLLARAQLQQRRGRVLIVSGDPNLSRLFEITGVDKLFAIVAPGNGHRPSHASLFETAMVSHNGDRAG